MKCEDCGSREKVIETRVVTSNGMFLASRLAAWLGEDLVRRRRRCNSCGAERRTVEITEETLEAVKLLVTKNQ